METPMEQKPEFDIVLWGATGFTGQLTADSNGFC